MLVTQMNLDQDIIFKYSCHREGLRSSGVQEKDDLRREKTAEEDGMEERVRAKEETKDRNEKKKERRRRLSHFTLNLQNLNQTSN